MLYKGGGAGGREEGRKGRREERRHLIPDRTLHVHLTHTLLIPTELT